MKYTRIFFSYLAFIQIPFEKGVLKIAKIYYCTVTSFIWEFQLSWGQTISNLPSQPKPTVVGTVALFSLYPNEPVHFVHHKRLLGFHERSWDVCVRRGFAITSGIITSGSSVADFVRPPASFLFSCCPESKGKIIWWISTQSVQWS